VLCRHSNDRAVGRVERFVLAEHLDAGIDQERAEEVQDPMETFDEFSSGEYHQHPQDEHHENSPKEDAVLIFFWNAEISEDQKENEEVIDRKEELDNVTGQEFFRLRSAEQRVDERIETERKRYPNSAPDERFLTARRVRTPVHDTDINEQRRQHDHEKCSPNPQRIFDHKILNLWRISQIVRALP